MRKNSLICTNFVTVFIWLAEKLLELRKLLKKTLIWQKCQQKLGKNIRIKKMEKSVKPLNLKKFYEPPLKLKKCQEKPNALNSS